MPAIEWTVKFKIGQNQAITSDYYEVLKPDHVNNASGDVEVLFVNGFIDEPYTAIIARLPWKGIVSIMGVYEIPTIYSAVGELFYDDGGFIISWAPTGEGATYDFDAAYDPAFATPITGNYGFQGASIFLDPEQFIPGTYSIRVRNSTPTRTYSIRQFTVPTFPAIGALTFTPKTYPDWHELSWAATGCKVFNMALATDEDFVNTIAQERFRVGLIWYIDPNLTPGTYWVGVQNSGMNDEGQILQITIPTP